MLLPPIATDRLLIRPFQPADWPHILAYTSDPSTMTYIPEGVFTADKAESFVAENSSEQAEAYAVVHIEEQHVIGHMKFHLWFAPRTYEIGWVLHKHYHGRGYATEAAFALLKYGFESLHLHRIIATCQPENIPSYRVMEKLGMRREGHFRKCFHIGEDQWWDEYFYAILEDEWHQTSPGGA
ncbi:MAG TPA: GNAT family N-acetyltransferase [Chloroflexia bacterium]